MINQRKNKKRIKHNINKNGNKLPIWVLIDILSFNNIAYLYSNLLKEDKKEINQDFLREYIQPQIVSGWLKHFSLLRNDCAHQERIYYEEFPNINIKTKVVKCSLKNNNNNLFSYLLCASHLIYSYEKWSNFLDELEREVEKYYLIDVTKIGFPENWKDVLLNEIKN